MRRFAFLSVLLAVLGVAWQAGGLSQISVRKTYGREIFTSADKNADEAYMVAKVNEVRAFFPGTDSLKIVDVVLDTLHARTTNTIAVAPADTLQPPYLDVTRMARIDTIWIGGNAVTTVGFSGGTTAGTRMLFSYLKLDSALATYVDLDGGYADGVTIGASTAAGGTFSTLRTTGDTLDLAALRDTVGAIISDSASAGGTVVDTTSTIAIPFSAGTSALPAITRLGDLNTGIYFPTADQVAVTNGGVRTLLVSGDDITVRDDINVGDDVLLPATGVVNWGAGDVTVTGGTGTLTLAGASSGYQFNDGNVGIGDATTITLGLGIEKASADVGMRVERTGDVASVGQYFIDSNGWVNIYAVTSGKNIGLITEGAGAVNVNSLGASASVSTDGSKNLTTASDSSWKQDQGEIDHATPILMGLRPRYWTWKKDMNGLLTNPARRDVWSSTRAEAWSRVTGSDSSTALAAVALKDRPALRAKVGRVSVLDEQPWIAGFFSQEVYAVFPEGSPGGPNLDSQGNEHWGLNTTAIIALTARALQEQVGRTDSLSAVVARQDSLIADLQVRVAKLEGP